MRFKTIVSSLLLGAALLLTTEASANAFKDVKADQFYSEAVTELHKQGIVSGYEDGTFKPNATITRAEVAKLVSNFSGRNYEVTNAYHKWMNQENDFFSFDYTLEQFKDVRLGQWYFDSVSSLVFDEVITGYPTGEFKPNDAITRGDFAIIVSKAFTMQFNPTSTKFEDIEGHYAKEAIMRLEQVGFISGATPTVYAPNKNITRAEVATILYRIHSYMHFHEAYKNVDVNYYDLLIDRSWENDQPPVIDESGTIYFVKGEDWESFATTLPKVETERYDYKHFAPSLDKNYIVTINASTCGNYITKAFLNDKATLTVNQVYPEYQWLKEDGSYLRCSPSIDWFVEIIEVEKNLEIDALRYTFYPFHFSRSEVKPIVEFNRIN